MSSDGLRVIIVGGGFGGLCAAIECRLRGMNPVILETVSVMKTPVIPSSADLQLHGKSTQQARAMVILLTSSQTVEESLRNGTMAGLRVN